MTGAGGGAGGRRAPSLRLVNGRATTGVSLHTSSTESVRSPHHQLGQQQAGNNNCHVGSNPTANNHPRLNKDDSIKISIENTNTCTDSLVTALDDETLLITDFLGDTGENHRDLLLDLLSLRKFIRIFFSRNICFINICTSKLKHLIFLTTALKLVSIIRN